MSGLLPTCNSGSRYPRHSSGFYSFPWTKNKCQHWIQPCWHNRRLSTSARIQKSKQYIPRGSVRIARILCYNNITQCCSRNAANVEVETANVSNCANLADSRKNGYISSTVVSSYVWLFVNCTLLNNRKYSLLLFLWPSNSITGLISFLLKHLNNQIVVHILQCYMSAFADNPDLSIQPCLFTWLVLL